MSLEADGHVKQERLQPVPPNNVWTPPVSENGRTPGLPMAPPHQQLPQQHQTSLAPIPSYLETTNARLPDYSGSQFPMPPPLSDPTANYSKIPYSFNGHQHLQPPDGTRYGCPSPRTLLNIPHPPIPPSSGREGFDMVSSLPSEAGIDRIPLPGQSDDEGDEDSVSGGEFYYLFF